MLNGIAMQNGVRPLAAVADFTRPQGHRLGHDVHTGGRPVAVDRTCLGNGYALRYVRVPPLTELDLSIGDEVYAIGDTCSHADASLAEGEVDEEDAQIGCHLHGAVFDVKTGEPLSLPATKPVPTYAVHVDGQGVYVSIER